MITNIECAKEKNTVLPERVREGLNLTGGTK